MPATPLTAADRTPKRGAVGDRWARSGFGFTAETAEPLHPTSASVPGRVQIRTAAGFSAGRTCGMTSCGEQAALDAVEDPHQQTSGLNGLCSFGRPGRSTLSTVGEN
jgi:hypothetical protein